jgi:hypothetical protein
VDEAGDGLLVLQDCATNLDHFIGEQKTPCIQGCEEQTPDNR